jgi:hypothetical protein
LYLHFGKFTAPPGVGDYQLMSFVRKYMKLETRKKLKEKGRKRKDKGKIKLKSKYCQER